MRSIVTATVALLLALGLPAASASAAAHAHGHAHGHARTRTAHVHHHGSHRHARRHHRGSHTAKPHRERREHREHSAKTQRSTTRGTTGSAPAPALPPAPGATSDCANTTVTPGAGNLEVVREATLCLINRERAANGEQPLRIDGKLVQAAQGHSENMVAQGYFSHESPSGSTPLDRIRAAGYIPGSQTGYEVGENIAWGTLSLASPKAIVEAWMASPEHRENILNPRYADTGLGIVPEVPGDLGEGQAGAVYTQDFGVLIAL